jgi:hypothetical protein
MLFKFFKTSILIVTCILPLGFIMPISTAGNYEKTYSFQFQYGLLNQKLYVAIPPSLYTHYGNISHSVACGADYAQLVTPQSVEPIAENIQKVTHTLPNSDEQFANAVLTLVHQIPYVITGVKFPVETIVNNSGDCVGLSLLAASIMKAGGLDVVLISYTGINPGHVNVGVYLTYTPAYHNILMAPTGFEYNNKTYWTAEATPEANWKVGDQSGMLSNSKIELIPLDNTENSTYGQVSASLGNKPFSSSITANLSQKPISDQNSSRGFIISGFIEPNFTEQHVDIYVQNSSFCDYFETTTDIDGNYALTWNFTSAGTYYITVSWRGTENYAGADSETFTVFVGPESFHQFQSPYYNYVLEPTNLAYYILGPSNTAPYVLRPLLGVDNFLSIPLNVNISFSYDFSILQTGHEATNISTETITIPDNKENTNLGRNRHVQFSSVPEQTLTVPTDLPPNMGPLTLPDNFNEAINNQFCFLLQNNGVNNCSLNMRALNGTAISNITEDNPSNMAFLNASDNLKDNTWYTITQSISEKLITTQINSLNGTLIKNMVTPCNVDNKQVVVLVANNVDSAVIMKDLKIQAQNNPAQTPSTTKKTIETANLIDVYVILAIVLAISSLAVTLYIKQKRK